jgi:hypothetical protein
MFPIKCRACGADRFFGLATLPSESPRPKRFQPFQRCGFALIVSIRFPPLAAALFGPLPHPRAAELAHNLGLLVLGNGKYLKRLKKEAEAVFRDEEMATPKMRTKTV